MNYDELLTPEEIAHVNLALKAISDRANFTITLGDLLGRWRDFIRSIELGYDDSIYEYANDMSVRDILDDVLNQLPEDINRKLSVAIEELDDRFKAATVEIAQPILSTPKREARYWWRRIPRKLRQELENDLRANGIL